MSRIESPEPGVVIAKVTEEVRGHSPVVHVRRTSHVMQGRRESLGGDPTM
jgi:hypothetical protein